MEKIVKETFSPDDEEVKKDEVVKEDSNVQDDLPRGAVGSTSPKGSQLEEK